MGDSRQFTIKRKARGAMHGHPRLFGKVEQLAQPLVSRSLGDGDLFESAAACSQSLKHGNQTV
jgi:hypothetical protein